MYEYMQNRTEEATFSTNCALSVKEMERLVNKVNFGTVNTIATMATTTVVNNGCKIKIAMLDMVNS